jgi:hypothetical protein
VVGGQATAAEAVEEDGDPERLGQRPQLVLAAAPVEAGPSHDRRPLGRGQQRRRRLDPLRRAGLGLRRSRYLRVGLGEDDVERVVDEGRAGGGRKGEVERGRGPGRDLARVLHGLRRLDQRRDEGQVVDLLQRARAPAQLRRPPTEDADR